MLFATRENCPKASHHLYELLTPPTASSCGVILSQGFQLFYPPYGKARLARLYRKDLSRAE